MESVSSSTQAGLIKAFSTDGGPHSPDTLAEMTIYQLGSGSNPESIAELRGLLVDHYTATQAIARFIYGKIPALDEARHSVNQILARDFATALDIERQWAKE
jgi:hypothetical protein